MAAQTHNEEVWGGGGHDDRAGRVSCGKHVSNDDSLVGDSLSVVIVRVLPDSGTRRDVESGTIGGESDTMSESRARDQGLGG